MSIDDRFEDLVASLCGFYRSWLIDLGLELGIFDALRDAGGNGLAPDELATVARIPPQAARYFAWAADAHDLVAFDDGRVRELSEVGGVLLDADRPEYLG